MRRRTVIAALAAAVGSGCGSRGGSTAGGSPDTDGSDEPTTEPAETTAKTSTAARTTAGAATSERRRYEECGREVIRFGMFPEPVQREIEAALEGRYAAERVFLAEAMDPDRSYVSVDGTYYDPAVSTADDREVLELRRVEPKAMPRPRPVAVRSELRGERRVRVSVVAEDGTVLLDETRAIRPGGAVEFGTVRRHGTHEVRVAVGDRGADATRTVQIDTSRRVVTVVVGKSGIQLQVAQTVPPLCSYADG